MRVNENVEIFFLNKTHKLEVQCKKMAFNKALKCFTKGHNIKKTISI